MRVVIAIQGNTWAGETDRKSHGRRTGEGNTAAAFPPQYPIKQNIGSKDGDTLPSIDSQSKYNTWGFLSGMCGTAAGYVTIKATWKGNVADLKQPCRSMDSLYMFTGQMLPGALRNLWSEKAESCSPVRKFRFQFGNQRHATAAMI